LSCKTQTRKFAAAHREEALDLTATLAEVFGIFLLAGFVKGVIGLGLPTVAIGLLGVIMTPAQAAASLVVPSFVTNVWQAAVGPALCSLAKRLWPMFAGIFVGAWASAGILTGKDSTIASGALGVVLAIYALLGLSRIHFSVPARAERWLAPLIGMATGVVTGATGVFVLPMVPYLQALDLERDELVQALGLSFLVSTVALAVVLVGSGDLHLSESQRAAAALVGALLGMGVGKVVRGSIRPGTFRLFFFGGLLLLGAHLVLRAFS
jgi:uncharacterized membrane protein YfcA